MILLIDKSDKIHEFKTPNDALEFLWGKDVHDWSVMVPTLLPNSYIETRNLLEKANVQGKGDSGLNQSGRPTVDDSGSDVSAVHSCGDNDAPGSSTERGEQPGNPVEETQDQFSSSELSRLPGFRAGPLR